MQLRETCMLKKLQQWCVCHNILCWSAAGVVLLYTLAGFVATPMAVHYVLKNKVSPALNRSVIAQTVRANPYSFAVHIKGLSVSDRNDGPFIQLDRIYINVDPLISLFKWGVAVKSVEIENPKVHVVRTAADQFNFSDMVPASEQKRPDEDTPPSESMRLILNTFKLSEGEIQFVDQARPLPFESTVSALNISLTQLDTHPNANPAIYRIEARTESNETLKVSGQADVEPLTVAATVNLEALAIAKYAPYYSGYMNAKVTEGTVGLGAKVNWSKEIQAVGDIGLNLSKLALTSSRGEPLAAVRQFQAAGASIDLKAREIRLGRVSTADGKIDMQKDKDGQLNLLAAFTPPSSKGADASDPASMQTPAWRVSIPDFEMRNYTIGFKDRQTDPEANIALGQITLSAKALSTRKDARGTVALSLNWADQGAVALQGDVGLVPPAAELEVEAKALDLRPLQPYINPHALLVVTRGLFDTKGKFKLMPQENRMDIQYAGVAAVNELKTVDKKKANDFINWKSLYLKGLELRTSPFRLNINEVSLTDFYNRLIINDDGVSNLAAIMTSKEESAPEVNNKQAAAPSQGESKSGDKIKINTVTLQGGSVDFSDLFVKPNVRLPMSKIAGRISGLDTIKENKANVLLKGIVGRNVPMEIKGEINPLIENPYVDLTIGLNGVDLSPFTPYSGKYLGYQLEKGQLSLDLTYQVADNKLSAQNKVLLNQLTLGETVDSPTATKLPIKLALALLKDRQGNIDLDLPMSGDLNNPEFSVGGMVVKMFTNLIVKVVSSPFSVLGALFGGGEELAFLDYEHGQSRIPEESFGKLDTLAKILFERPGLKMEIQGQVNREEDINGLRRLKLEEQLKAFKLKSMIAQGKKAVPLEQIELAGPQRDKMVEKAYAKAKLPKPRDKKGKRKKLSSSEKEKLLYTAIEISDDDLRLLAHQRAQTAKDYLVNQGKVEVSRIFIVEPQIENEDPKAELLSRVKFNLT